MIQGGARGSTWTFLRSQLAGLVATLMVGAAGDASAQGGPPLLTDDPDTPGPRHWEINLAAIAERTREAREFAVPLADVNYGVGRRIQLKFEIPWLAAGVSASSLQAGLGNSNSGVKWRFLGQEGRKIAWSIYPQCAFNTSESMASKGLVDRSRRCVVPTEVTVEVRRIELNGEVGPLFVQDRERGWIAGVSTELTITKAFELVGEVHAERDGSATPDVIVNIGGRRALTERVTLLAAGGRAAHGPHEERERFRLYVGLQLNLPGRYAFARSPVGP